MWQSVRREQLFKELSQMTSEGMYLMLLIQNDAMLSSSGNTKGFHPLDARRSVTLDCLRGANQRLLLKK